MRYLLGCCFFQLMQHRSQEIYLQYYTNSNAEFSSMTPTHRTKSSPPIISHYKKHDLVLPTLGEIWLTRIHHAHLLHLWRYNAQEHNFPITNLVSPTKNTNTMSNTWPFGESCCGSLTSSIIDDTPRTNSICLLSGPTYRCKIITVESDILGEDVLFLIVAPLSTRKFVRFNHQDCCILRRALQRNDEILLFFQWRYTQDWLEYLTP